MPRMSQCELKGNTTPLIVLRENDVYRLTDQDFEAPLQYLEFNNVLSGEIVSYLVTKPFKGGSRCPCCSNEDRKNTGEGLRRWARQLESCLGRQLLYFKNGYPWVYSYDDGAFINTPCNNFFSNIHSLYVIHAVLGTCNVNVCCAKNASVQFFHTLLYDFMAASPNPRWATSETSNLPAVLRALRSVRLEHVKSFYKDPAPGTYPVEEHDWEKIMCFDTIHGPRVVEALQWLRECHMQGVPRVLPEPPEFIRGSKIKGYRIFTVSMHQLGEKLLQTPVRKTKSGKAAMAKTGKAAMAKTALKNIPVKRTPPKKISPQKTKIKMRAKRTACLDQFPAAMREASPTSPPPCPTPAHSLLPCNPTTNGEAAHGDSECKVHTPENGKCQASGQLQARCNAGSMTHAPFHPAKKSCPEAVKYYTPTPSQPIVHDALPTPIHALMLQRSGAFSPAQSTAAAFPASDACCAIYSGEDKSCASVYQAFQNDSGVDFPFDASLPYVEVELWQLEMVMSNRSSLAPPPAVDGMAFAQASEILLLDGQELVLEDCADMDFDFESGTE